MTHKNESVIEKIRTILNSENTTTFLNNVTKPLGNKTRKPIIIRRQDAVNSFLDNIFTDDIEDLNNTKSINNLIINDKKIIVKAISYKSNNFFFNSFEFREGDEFDVKKNLKKTIEKLNSFNYFLIILIFEGKKNENFKVKYNFYLIPSEHFNFDIKVFRKIRRLYKGENWIIQNNKEFKFKFNINNLGNPIFSYIF